MTSLLMNRMKHEVLEGRTKRKQAIKNKMKTTFYDSEGQKGNNLKSEYRCGEKVKTLQLQLQLYPSSIYFLYTNLLLVTTTR